MIKSTKINGQMATNFDLNYSHNFKLINLKNSKSNKAIIVIDVNNSWETVNTNGSVWMK